MDNLAGIVCPVLTKKSRISHFCDKTLGVSQYTQLNRKDNRVFTFTDLDESHHYDEYQGQEFSNSENILDPCCPADTVAVHPGQEH